MRRGIVLLALTAVLAIVGAACSSDDGGGGTTTPPATGQANGTVLTIVDFEFDPSTVTVGADGALVVQNNGAGTHTFTMDDGSVDETIDAGQSVSVTVTTAGPFHCKIHPQMTGTVEIG